MTTIDPTLDYFHIQRSVPWGPQQQPTAGSKFDVGGSSNPFFGFFETRHLVLQARQADGSQITVPAMYALKAAASNQLSVANVAAVGRDVASHFIKYVRELIWEDVRRRIHRARETFLLGDSEPMSETIRKARQYWLGIVEDLATEEVIFEGRVSVMEVVAPESYG
jgi:hypothetical protein